jgi:hypothetical protein
MSTSDRSIKIHDPSRNVTLAAAPVRRIDRRTD